jgi:hypothetical protein
MLKPVLTVTFSLVLGLGACGAMRAASSHGGHGSRAGGHSHGGGWHGGGSAHFHGSGGGNRGGSSHSLGLFHGGSSHRGGGGSRDSVKAFRGGFFGSSPSPAKSRGFSAPPFAHSRAFSNFGGPWGRSSGQPSGRMSSSNFSNGNAWSRDHGSAQTSLGHSFDGNRPARTGNRWDSSARFSRTGSSWNRTAYSGFSHAPLDFNRPPSRQFDSMSRPQRSASNWPGGAARRNSASADRSFGSFNANRPPWSQSSFANASARGRFGGRNMPRSPGSSGPDRPTGVRRAGLRTISGRGNSSWVNIPRFGMNRGQSNLGASRLSSSRLAAGNFTHASFSSFSRFGSGSGFGSNRFGTSRGYGFRHQGFRHGGLGYGGFRNYGFGYGRGGGDSWLSAADFWFLGDLFGLALDFGRLAIMPPWGFIGSSLLDAGLQAFNWDDPGYDNSYRSDDYYASGAPFNFALCGRYYSDENPGCLQQF